jgi:hypothetical protein
MPLRGKGQPKREERTVVAKGESSDGGKMEERAVVARGESSAGVKIERWGKWW